jgi:hypothetical protein
MWGWPFTAREAALCANAQFVKYGQKSPTPTAVADLLPDEPGGYNGYQALFGAKYIDPLLGEGTPSLTHDGYPVTNAAGNITDLNGGEIDGAFLNNYPGFPGFGEINAARTLAYMSDMLENNVPVVYGYMADRHGNEGSPPCRARAPTRHLPSAAGSACYIAQAQYYNAAFGAFFKRLADDGITPKNTLFVFSSDEGGHEAGANVGRALQPTPAGCDGSPANLCSYNTSNFGELEADVTGLLATESPSYTPPAYSIEPDTAPDFYVNGNPSAGSPQVRRLEHNVAGLWADNPYSGNTHELITNYLADPTEEAILHMVNADRPRHRRSRCSPNRTTTT